ncbi:MAG TPA: colanic acid biosynthesis glycosyltransferase WcaL [Planctomycetaceae bacterium]|nr:colanic acid biosynthesis glycosyltransferase WcaL [Planctomycetaceae bacterium]
MNSPLRYLQGLALALRLAEGAPRAMVYRLFYFVEAVVVARRMKQMGSSHLHVHFGSEVATVALLVKQVAPVTLSLSIHGSDEFYDAPGYHLTRKIEEADFIFCISHYTASQLMRLSGCEHWGKITVSPLGVDVRMFSPATAARDHKALNVLCVGRLDGAKGIHLLLRAVARLQGDMGQLRLTLVGDGEERASLLAFADSLGVGDRVEFAGAVNQDNILPYYQRADVFCLPSFAEGVPVVLMEAMAMEIPCVASRITGIPELIEDGKDGVLFTAADVDSLTAALRRLLEAPELRKAIGKAARQKVVAHYNREINFNALGCHFEANLDALESAHGIEEQTEWAPGRYV